MNREFKNAILLKMSQILEQHSGPCVPGMVHSDKEIIEFLEELILILNN